MVTAFYYLFTLVFLLFLPCNPKNNRLVGLFMATLTLPMYLWRPAWLSDRLESAYVYVHYMKVYGISSLHITDKIVFAGCLAHSKLQGHCIACKINIYFLFLLKKDN